MPASSSASTDTALMNTTYRPSALSVFAISVLLLSINLSHAPMMFDESYYVRAARELLAGAPTNNPEHPPLAKSVMAASIKVFGDKPFGWRFPSVLAGGLAGAAIFGITRRLTQSMRTAMIAWLLTVAGGFWFVMSRVAMLSIYQLAFELAGVWLFLIALEQGSMQQFALSGALFGLSIGCRWCGAVGPIACLIVLIVERAKLRSVLAMLAATLIAYCAAWLPLLIRERRPFSYLVTANQFILHFHRNLNVDPRLGERWWTWFLRLTPQESLAHLVANPIIGLLGLFAVPALLWKRVEHAKDKSYILSLLYLGHVGQWVIGVRHLTFYYHYMEAFIVLAPALAIAMGRIEWHKVRLDVVVTACSLLFFVYWYPTWADLPEPFNLLMGAH